MSTSTIIAKAGLGQSSRLLNSWTKKYLDNTQSPEDVFNRLYCKPAGGAGAKKPPAGGLAGVDRGHLGTAAEEAFFLNKQKESLAKIKEELKKTPELPKKK